jgi:hypothetical protein
MGANKGLLGFLIAGSLAVIAFLIYWFFFRKKKTGVDSSANAVGILGAVVGSTTAQPGMSTNPISPQDSSSGTPEYVPVNPDFPNVDKEFGTAAGETTEVSIRSTGFNPTPQETLETGSALSERANNPGALFWDGSTNWQGLNSKQTKVNQIIYFDNVDYGVRAQLMTLKNYYKKHGIDTLIGITIRYAPVGHGNNNPTVYAQSLASCMGMNTTDKFNLDSNRNLLAAIGYYMHRIEAGYFWVPREKYLEWSTKV